MKKTKLLLLVLLMFFCSYCNAVDSSTVSNNIILRQKIDSIESRMYSLKSDIEKYHLKENFYSDMISLNITWFSALVAFGAALFGFISWRKFKKIENYVDKTCSEAKVEMNQLKNDLEYQMNEMKYEMARLTGNVCYDLANICYKNGDYEGFIFYHIECLIKDRFDITLCKDKLNNKFENEKERIVDALQTRLKIFNEKLEDLLNNGNYVEIDDVIDERIKRLMSMVFRYTNKDIDDEYKKLICKLFNIRCKSIKTK